MPHITIVQRASDIHLGPGWVPATKFESRHRVVTHSGARAEPDELVKYRIIQKWERPFSACERISRVVIGVLLFIGTGGGIFFFAPQYVRQLFTQSKEKIRFAI